MFENMDSDIEIIAEFITESTENLDDLDSKILSLEETPDDKELLNHVFRAIHTVKGGSGFLSLEEITSLSHKLENILDDLRNDALPVTPEILDVVLEGIDTLKKLFDILTEECESPGSTKGTVFDLNPIFEKMRKVKSAGEQVTTSESVEQVTTSESTEDEIGEKVEEESSLDEEALFQNLIEENRATFVDETKEYIETVDNDLIKLENGDELPSTTENIFRIIHNIKGNAAYLGYGKIERLSHNFENILDELRKGKIEISQDICKLLFKAFDTFKIVFNVVSETGSDTGENDEIDIEEIISEINDVIGSKQSQSTPNEDHIPEVEESDESDDLETKKIFTRNAKIYLKIMTNCLNKIRNNKTDEASFDNLLRALNNMSDASKFVNFFDLKSFIETKTSFLNLLKAHTDGITRDSIDLMLFGVESCSQFIDDVENGNEAVLDDKLLSSLNSKCNELKEQVTLQDIPVEPPIIKETEKSVEKTESVEEKKDVDSKPAKVTPAPKKSKPNKVEQSIRVEHSKLDILMNLIGELIINRNHLEMLSEKIDSDYNLPDISKELNRASVSLGKISDDLQNSIMSVRMIPVGTVFNKFPRVVRDLAKSNKKDIELIISGEETNLDKTIIEQIGDPLIHLIRNGVDHGIELPEERKNSNKPQKGTIHLRAFQKADNVIIEIEDNGKGMDPAIIRNKAVDKGIISKEDAEKLGEEDSFNLIFEAGFSTAEQITDISGRGVGMDVVRNNIRKLGGTVTINSKKGFGSRFTLSLPLTLAIIRAIMVKLANNTFAIPLNAIVETIKIPSEQVKTLKNKKVINLRGEVIGIVDLISLMNVPQNDDTTNKERSLIPIVIISSETKKIGLIVDDLLRQQEIVIKPLIDFLASITGLSGATILGDGKIVLILDPTEVFTLATAGD